MAKIILIADTCEARAAYLESCQLPRFYMEDFSIQGFTVQQYDDARNLIRRAGYRILDKAGSSDIFIDEVRELMAIRSLLRQNGIQVELSDIADTMYQA